MRADVVPVEPEVHGLQALLERQASRLGARVDPAGNAVLLEDQDRALWDELLIRRGLSALATAEQLAASERPVGRYFLQAVIAAHHARADTAQETDWRSEERRVGKEWSVRVDLGGRRLIKKKKKSKKKNMRN